MVAPQPTRILMSDDGPGCESTWLMPTCASVGHVHGHAIATRGASVPFRRQSTPRVPSGDDATLPRLPRTCYLYPRVTEGTNMLATTVENDDRLTPPAHALDRPMSLLSERCRAQDARPLPGDLIRA